MSKSSSIPRRDFIVGSLLASGAAMSFPSLVLAGDDMKNKFGLFGKLQAKPGQGQKLSEILMRDTKALKGCILYVVCRDVNDPDAIHVMEVWETKDDHANSLKLPSVRAAIAEAMPLIAEPPTGGTTLEVLGGKGV
jgi:quinol monooxygenase YgiN